MRYSLGAVAILLAVVPGIRQPQPTVTTLAFRVHKMDAMVAFYTEAFGASFRDVQTGNFSSRFTQIGGMTLKFVPIRDGVDFTGFPVHQPGFVVGDIHRVIAIAEKHGGKVLNPPVDSDGRLTAAVRDPDGNPIELYERARR